MLLSQESGKGRIKPLLGFDGCNALTLTQQTPCRFSAMHNVFKAGPSLC